MTIKKLICLIVLPLFFVGNVYSETLSELVFGCQYNGGYGALELGMTLSERKNKRKYANIHTGGEVLFGSSVNGVKAGFDFAYDAFQFSGNLVEYFKGFEHITVLRPEMGFTLWGYVDLAVGYNVFTQKEDFNLGKYVVTFRIKYPFEFMQFKK